MRAHDSAKAAAHTPTQGYRCERGVLRQETDEEREERGTCTPRAIGTCTTRAHCPSVLMLK
eukprot:3615385-Pyramimonas_sp.AAC.1